MRRKQPPITHAQARAMQSPLSLDEIVARAKRNDGELERLKIVASPQARAHRDQLIQTGHLDGNRQVAMVEQISAYAAKEKERQRRKNAAPIDNGPTPERRAKLLGVDAITPPINDGGRTAGKAHIAQGVVEFYHGKWSYEAEQGAKYLRDLWAEAQSGQPKSTPNYDGTPGGSFGPRRGGVAAHTKEQNFDVIKAEAIVFGNFGSRGLQHLRWFFWDKEKPGGEGLPLLQQMERAGRSLAPFIEENKRLSDVTYGFIYGIALFAYQKWVVDEKAMERKHSTPEEIAARRKARQERMQREGLVHPAQDGPAFPKGRREA